MAEAPELTRAERRLGVALAFLGFLALLGALQFWLPGALLKHLWRWAGIPPEDVDLLSVVPVFWFLLRALGVLFFATGLLFLIASNDPLGHAALVRVTTLALALLAIVVAVSGWVLKMPIPLYSAKAVGSLFLCLLLALLYRNALLSLEEPPEEPEGPSHPSGGAE